MNRLLVPLALALVACAPPMPNSATTPAFADGDGDEFAGVDSVSPAPTTSASASEAALEPARVAAPAMSGGHIDGGALDTILDAGPGAFLASVAVRPVFSGKRFRGWEITRIRSERLARSPLRRGDMVVAVNDKGLRRPEDLQRVWEELRNASELVVSGVRSGQNFALRYEIVRR